MLKREKLLSMLTFFGIMMFATTLLGQSFYKTYNQRVPAYPYKILANGSGTKIYASNSSFNSNASNFYEIRTDAIGNLQSNVQHNLGSYAGEEVTFRTDAGQYIIIQNEENNRRMRVRIVNSNGSLARTVNLFYPAGSIAATGAAAQYPNGDIAVTFYYGAPWSDPQNVQNRSARWARIRPSTGAVIGQGTFNPVGTNIRKYEANTAIVGRDNALWLGMVEERSSGETHFLVKINANGSFGLRQQVATLERGINQLATRNNGIAYNHTQSIEGVRFVNNNGSPGGNVLPEPIFMEGLPRETLVGTPDGGVMIIVQNSSDRSPRRANIIYTLKVSSNGTVVAQNKITQINDGSYKEPTAAYFNSAGELLITGIADPTPVANVPFDARPFLLKLGSNGQWVNGGGGGNGVDLELTSVSSNPSPNVWESTDMTITLRNTGSQAATNVQVKVDIPSGLILQGGNEYTASRGSFSPYGNQVWNVGNVPANSTHTLKLNFYNANTNSKNVFAQVQSAGGNDADSNPGNGTCCTGLEDDETFTPFNSGGTGGNNRFPDLRGGDVRLSRTSAAAGSVLNFTFDLINSGQVAVSGDYRIQMRISTNQLTGSFGTRAGVINTGNTALGTTQDVPGAITIPANTAPGTYYLWISLDDNLQVLETNESNNRFRSVAFTITAGGGGNPLPDLTPTNVQPGSFNVTAGGPLGVNFTVVNNGGPLPASQVSFGGRLYLSQNTTIDASDFVVGNLTLNPGPGSIAGIIPTNIPPGQYYALVQLDPNNRVQESNESNNVGRNANRITVGEPIGGGGAIDISMSASPSNPRQWAFFSTTITARNTGSSRANNVRVKLTTPSAITYRGGMEYTSSKGTLDWWNSETWNIGSLNAGQTATLTVNFFRLAANGFTISSNVTSGGGNDSASVNFGSAANGVNNRSAVINNMQNEPFAIVNAYPNPTTEHITIAVYSNEAQSSDLEIFSLTGKRVFGNNYELEEGLNEIKIETAQFQSGQYFIKMNPFHPYLRKIDFTKVK